MDLHGALGPVTLRVGHSYIAAFALLRGNCCVADIVTAIPGI